MAVSSLTLSCSSAFAEESSTTAETNVADSAVTTTDSVSSLIAEDLKKTEEEYAQKQELTHVIYDIEYDAEKGLVDIDYLSKTNCTVFVGFYNDEGTELYSSLTKNVQAADDGHVQLTVLESLPEHYLIKTYLIGNHQNALCKALTYEKCTKVMQEILAKTTDDFTKKDIINFDEDKSNNFFVVAQGVANIHSDDKNDTYDGMSNGQYHFSNAKEIAKLTKDKMVVVETPDDLLTFKVKAITNNKDGSYVITPDSDWKPELEDLFEFIKVDTDKMEEKPEFEVVEFTEDGTPYKVETGQTEDGTPYKVVTPETEVKQEYKSSVSPVPENTINDSKKRDVDVGPDHFYKQVEFGISDTCTFTVSLDVNCEYYIGFGKKFYDYDIIKTYRLTASAGETPDNNAIITNFKSFETEVNHRLHTPTFAIPINGAMKISFDAAISIKVLGCIDVTYTEVTHHTYNNGVETTNTEKGGYDCVLRGEITFDISFNITFSIIRESLLAGVLTASVGVTAYGIINPGGIDGVRKHNCDVCLDITSFLYAGLKVSVKVLDQTVASRTIAEIRLDMPKLNLSKKYGLIEGDCLNYSYLMKYRVKDQNGNPISGVKVTSNKNNIKPKYGEKEILTNNKGEAEFWIDMSDYDYEFSMITGTAPTGETDLFSIYSYYDSDSKKAKNIERTIKLKGIETDKDTSDDIDSQNSSSKNIIRMLCHGEVGDGVEYILFENGSMYILGKGELDFTSHGIPSEFKECVINIIVMSPDVDFSSTYFDYYKNLISFDGSVSTKTTNLVNGAFAKCSLLRDVKLPDSIKTIESSSFRDCSSLKEITLPKSLEKISKNAFEYSGLETIVIPSNVNKIETYAFGNCNNVKVLIINSDYDHVSHDNLHSPLFGTSGPESIRFSDNVTKINPYDFEGSRNLKNVRLSNNLKIINNSAFERTGIESLILPESLETIEEYAFEDSELKEVTIPEGVTKIGARAFKNDKLTKVSILNTECKLGNDFVSDTTLIYGYMNSTAHQYTVDTHTENRFVPLELETPSTISGSTVTTLPITTTTTVTTTAPTTTVFTYTNAVPDSEYVLIAVKDASAIKTENIADSDVEKAAENQLALLSPDNIIYFDQQTADENGTVTFSFVKSKEPDVQYILTGDFGSHKIDQVISSGEPKVDAASIVTYEPDVRIEEPDSNTETADVLYGDANGNGTVDMSDAVLIMQMLANPSKFQISPEFKENADVYQPRTGITPRDALSIQKYLLQIIPELPEY